MELLWLNNQTVTAGFSLAYRGMAVSRRDAISRIAFKQDLLLRLLVVMPGQAELLIITGEGASILLTSISLQELLLQPTEIFDSNRLQEEHFRRCESALFNLSKRRHSLVNGHHTVAHQPAGLSHLGVRRVR